eukprot:1450897-Prymnesium_polylepis.1
MPHGLGGARNLPHGGASRAARHRPASGCAAPALCGRRDGDGQLDVLPLDANHVLQVARRFARHVHSLERCHGRRARTLCARRVRVCAAVDAQLGCNVRPPLDRGEGVRGQVGLSCVRRDVLQLLGALWPRVLSADSPRDPALARRPPWHVPGLRSPSPSG